MALYNKNARTGVLLRGADTGKFYGSTKDEGSSLGYLSIYETPHSESTARRRQHLAGLLASLAAVCAGSVQGWTSPALPYLQHEAMSITGFNSSSHNSFIGTTGITANQASWIGSIAALGGLCGAIPSGYLANKLGRKVFLLLLAVPYFTGWLIIAVAKDSVPLLYISRFISGAAMGAATVVTPLYNEEIAEDNVRGALGVYFDMMVTVGIVWSYAIGSFVPYIWLAVLCGLLPVLFFCTYIFMPESPLYLLSRGKVIEAERSLRWLRASTTLQDENIKVELDRMKSFLDSMDSVTSSAGSKTSLLSIMASSMSNFSTSSPTFRACLIVFGLMIVQQISFINAVLFYTADIFESIGGSLSPLLSTIIVGIVQVIATLSSFLLVDKLGRRALLLFSEVGVALSLAGLALDIYLKNNAKMIPANVGLIPLFCLIIFVVAYSVGFGPLPWLIMAEVSPVEYKGVISSTAVFINWSLVFATTYIFNGMVSQIGSIWTYGIISVVAVLCTVFVFLFIPETKGKSREEIQKSLKDRLIHVF